jgi:hypothetical protein
LRFGVIAGLAKGVGRIMMRADKVGRQPGFLTKPDEIVDPGVRRSSRLEDLVSQLANCCDE